MTWWSCENIGFGKIEEVSDQERIELAAYNSLAVDVIGRLPGGYDQMLGRRFDGGLDLSGGEWQKLALARAYMRDAQLLILDEPTATLDARAEHEAFQRFVELTRGRMTVLISAPGSRPCAWPTASWCWTEARFSSGARTTS